MPSAADRNRLAAALAYEQERRRRLAEFIPTPSDGTQTADQGTDVATNLQNLSIGLGRGITTQLQGLKGIVTDPVGSAKAGYEAVKGIVRDPSVLAEALRQTGQRAMSGPLGAGEVIGEMAGPMRGKPTMAEIDVYHGSPHVFDEFDASKIGTGEGAQAYGHGIYFAENPKVAAGYRSQLAPGTIRTIDGGDYDSANPEHIAASYLHTFRHKNYSPQKIANILEEDANLLQQEGHKKAAEILRSGKIEKLGKLGHRPSGALYTADLPDEMVDRMLDWDKPLSEQSQAIQDLARKIGAGKAAGPTKAKMKAFIEGKENAERGIVAKGEDLYRALSDYGGQSVEGSRALQSVGIPGIRYLDAGSRGQGGTGTRNFVVFPGEEKKVKILKRE